MWSNSRNGSASAIEDKVANDVVALLRAEAGHDPYDRQLSDLIGDCPPAATSSGPVGRPRCANPHHRRRAPPPPCRRDLELAFTFPLGADPSQTLVTYTAEPGSRSHDALNLLASWSATTDNE